MVEMQRVSVTRRYLYSCLNTEHSRVTPGGALRLSRRNFLSLSPQETALTSCACQCFEIFHTDHVTSPQTASPSATTTSMGVRNDAMYERSKLHLAAKRENLKQTERKLMEDCTFTPETNKSRSSSNSGNTTVFDRLYSESKRTTPTKANGRRSGNSQKRSPTSVSSHGSSRIDYLYQDGLRRAQNRRLTDKEEAEARQRRLEEKELKQCTFRPNMDWRKKKDGKEKGTHQDPVNVHSTRYQYSPPVHVVTTQPALIRRSVGQRSMLGLTNSIVSPLRGPDLKATLSAVPSSIESLGEDTEYGSI